MKIKEFLKTIQGLAGNTREAYEETLWQLHESMKDGDEPTPEHIKKFLGRYKSSSMHRHKAAIKAYLEFRGQPWPFNRRQFRVPRRRIPRYVNPDLIESVAAAGDDEGDSMYVLTLFNLGCRISELMGIEEDDITDTGVHLTTKGGHHLLTPMTREFAIQLKDYAAKKKKGKVFPEKYSYYYERLKELGRKAGVPKISPHMLRHARAVDLLNKKMPLPYVQQFLHHASINSTAIYLEITGGELGEELEKADLNGRMAK